MVSFKRRPKNLHAYTTFEDNCYRVGYKSPSSKLKTFPQQLGPYSTKSITLFFYTVISIFLMAIQYFEKYLHITVYKNEF